MTVEIKNLLQKLANDSVFEDFYFIGGTALSYYLEHRISYDLDFITTSKLKVDKLKPLVIKYNALFIPDTNASVFKINTGSNIEEYKMIFNIDGIKLNHYGMKFHRFLFRTKSPSYAYFNVIKLKNIYFGNGDFSPIK